MAVKAPPGFQPHDAEQQRVNVPPSPTRRRKEDLYRSVLEFQNVDDHAIQVAQMEHDNFTDLIWHLVYSANFRTQLEKVRVIFRWMTTKNMHAITFKDGAKPGSPEEVLLSFKQKQGTYARTFEVLCRFAGLTSTILTGYAKGLDYRPGNHFKDSNYNHSWNAVLVDDSWYLIDSHWATRYLVSEKNVAENLVYEYDDFFFLTNPEQLIYSHWSQANEWQLLDQAVSLSEFESMPLVKSYFFKCAMYFVSHQNGVISTKNGRLALTLGYKKPTNFSLKITMADSGDEMYQGQKLKNFALQHRGHAQTDTLLFRAPKAGAYYFSFFAQLLTGEVGVKSTFTAACEYKVVADTASPDAVPLPVCSDSTWGPGFAVEQLGLVPNPPEGIITTTSGKVFLEFRKTKPAYVLCKLRRNGVEEDELERYIRDQDFGEAVQVTFQLPSTGEYGIEVYGNDPAKDGDTYTHVCQYYVHFAAPDEQQRAFYQDSPERRATMESFVFTTTAPAGYQPGCVGLESGTANLTLSDPDLPPPPPEADFPPPPPEMLTMTGGGDMIPDMPHESRYLPGKDPDLYHQELYASGNVPDPHQARFVSAGVPDTRQQQQYMSGGAPGTLQQQAPYVSGSVADPNQRQYLPGLVPPEQQQQQQRPVVSEVRVTPAAGGTQLKSYPPGGDQTAAATFQMSFSGPGVVNVDRKDVYAPGDNQQDVIAPGDVKVMYTTPPGQRDISAPEVVRAEVYAPGQKDVYAPAKDSYAPVQKEIYGSGNVAYSPQTDQREISAPGVGQKTVWTPGGQKEVYAPGAAQKNVWAPGSITQGDLDASTTGPEQKSKPPPTYKKPAWPPSSAQKDSNSATPAWKTGSTPRPTGAPTGFQKVTYAPDVIRKPAWTPNTGLKEADTPAQKNVWKPGSIQDATAPAAGQKVSSAPPPVAKKPTWTPGSVQREGDAPAPNVWKPGSVQQKDAGVSQTDQKGYAPVTVQRAVWTPSGSGQRDASDTPAAAGQKNVWTPSSVQKKVWTPGSAQGDADAPSAERKDVYAPGTDQRSMYAPGTDPKSIQAPGTDQGSMYAPGTDQRSMYAPGTDQRSTYAPGTDQRSTYAPGTDQRSMYAPGTDPQSIQAPGTDQRSMYAPGTDQRSTYAPGTDQRSTYAPGTDQRSMYAPGTDPQSIQAPGTDQRSMYAPGTDQGSMYAPGTDQRSTYAPGTDQRSMYAPGTDPKSIQAPGADQRSTYAPGTDQRSMYAPGTDPKSIQAPGTDQRSMYAPGTDQRSTYAPGTDQRSMYAPGTDPKSIQGPGQKNTWTPGSAPRDADAPGSAQRPGYGPGSGYAATDVQKDIMGMLPQQAVVTSVVIPASTRPLEVQKRSVGQAPPPAPREFQLLAVDQDRGEAPSPTPVPAAGGPGQPMPSLQAIDQQVLMSVDDHAIQVSKSDHNSFRDLVWDLIFSKNITNEIEKVRVIFRWLASKNLKEMNFERVEKGSPEEVLMGLNTGVTTYAMLFDIMCSYAGLHSKIISGYAKGADYIPGMKFASGQNQHTWNAVYLYGTWCLLDAHWGARRLVGKQTSVDDFHYQLDEYFFLTDPHQLIYTHLPDDPRWQLLDRRVTLEEFESMPHMKPQFFKFGLEFATHRSAIIRSAGGGEMAVKLRYPPGGKVRVAFNFTVQFESGEEAYNGVKLNKFGMHDNDNEEGVATFNLRLPVTGSYILFIYAKEDTADKSESVYSQVCEYKIEHQAAPGSTAEPFPPCSSLTWGPSSAFYRYGLSTEQRSPVLVMRDGKAQLQIQHPRPMQFMGRLKHSSMADADLESYVMQRTVGNTVVFDVSSPGRGEYGLEVFANDPATDGQTLYHNAQYLVVCHEDVRTTPLPKLPPGYLGPQPRFTEFGMMAVSHPDPVIQLDTNAMTLVLKSGQPMRVLANLIAVEGEEDFSTFTFSHTSEGNSSVFLVHLPKEGFYKLQIYGTPVSDQGQQIPGIYNYLVDCRQVTQPVFPFPKQFAQWKEGCFMSEPVAIVTPRGPFASQVQKERLPDMVTFCVDIPGAKSVAVVVDQDWTHLEKGGRNSWSGQVKVGHCYGTNTRLTLNANLGGDKTNYATLLEYFL